LEDKALSQSDPTDNALAAIASILDGSEAKSSAPPAAPVDDDTPSPSPAEIEVEVEVDGYSKLGPGPLDSIRFKWTARRDSDGKYYVDETVGDTKRAISTGPMPKHEVIKFIDERERVARERFEELRNELNSGAPAQPPNSGGES
jgi:hypothetical protein